MEVRVFSLRLCCEGLNREAAEDIVINAIKTRLWAPCHCSCHNNPGVTHPAKCCTTCRSCNRHIAGSLAEHVRECHPSPNGSGEVKLA